MSQGESAGITISGLSGETITRHPGSINGESLTLRDLNNCSVYVLDHSSEVEASNCVDCQLFVGPVDGAAIFDECRGCTVAVASQQFQARKCSEVDFQLYCATAPTVRSCKGVKIGCWVGAYPGLSRHFEAANLDPGSNQWRKVHDATPAEEREGGGEGEGGEADAPPFEVVESSPSWWEVPVEGGAPPDNPVPASEGALYSPPSAAASPAGAAAAAPAAAAAGAAAASAFGSGLTPAPSAEMTDPLAPPENGGPAAAAAALSASPPAGNGGGAAAGPAEAAQAAARAARERLARQEDAERAARAEAQAKAAAFLSEFYARRAAAAARPKTEAAAQASTPGGGGGPSGATPWERVLSMLDLDAAAPGGGSSSSARSSGAGGVSAPPNAADLSRFKAAMFTAKAKGLGL